LENGAWPHPARLPLGRGWSGHCTAPGHEGEVPDQTTIEQSCNLGYAGSCPRLPQDRSWDAVRFAMAAQGDEDGDGPLNREIDAKNGKRSRVVQLLYVCERGHRPVEHGRLSFDTGSGGWLQRHADVRVQKMAECFLESYQGRRTLPAADTVAS
jgi:hypothetical protein